MEKPFSDALPVIDALKNAGFEAYFVGGSVRDKVLSRPVDDIDIATSARPEQIKIIFHKTVDVGISHGTILVLFKGNSYEVTTFRTESGYKDFRRPDQVEFVSNLHEDLKRRDFTMNAMAMDRNGKLLDPFGGRDDIEKRQIRTVGSPSERFGEDALRLLRAARFASQLGFSIELHTYSSLIHSASLLKHIAVERKKSEFEKLLIGAARKIGLEILCKTGMLHYLPGLAEKAHVVRRLISYEIESLYVNEMWALLLHCMEIEGNKAEAFLRGWKLSVKQMKDIVKLLHFYHLRLENEWDNLSLFKAGKAVIASVEKLILATQGESCRRTPDYFISLFDDLPIKERDELAISGGDLIRWYGKSGGPWVKEMLEHTEKAVLSGKVKNDKETIREWLLRCSQK
ncbi:CCA tRNA nucleotidyltransferase [Neobacillus notoginsengisoli]|uniref:CCA-adding enzyme n=2 Tax=Neobacillus notoginsengisoli TaxID=1578198 RepID=A0A417YVH0_9BACI|nr:CCA tRNA nucleotidyltransferase [Neobacillus notoginsengisoli]RHW41270.1 CCA tRNA nucleotidyltransferase [Neobacillus notoginsengisoli]